MPGQDLFHALIGHESETIAWWQMSIRGVLIFLVGVVLLRLGGRRIFSRITPFDIILAVLIGSSLSRALTGNAPFIPTVAAMAAVLAAHGLLGALAFRWHPLGKLLKGDPIQLVRDGEIDWNQMRRHSITERDLLEALRTQGVGDVRRARAVFLERSGNISVLK